MFPSVKSLLARYLPGLFSGSAKRFESYAASPEAVAALSKTAESDLECLFYTHSGRCVHKWAHYLKVYEREFAHLRGAPIRFLEIGVSEGGSLELWRSYFGEQAMITGIDINSACQNRVDPPNKVRTGSQTDAGFLANVVEEFGGELDVVLDDGSHVASHISMTFKLLFKHLKAGGLYVIEDMHTAYWPEIFEGGYRRKGTAVELGKTVVDDMHGWYHDNGQEQLDKTEIASVRFYDSILVIEKADVAEPRHIKVGSVS